LGHQPGRGEVVGGEHRETLAFLALELEDGGLFHASAKRTIWRSGMGSLVAGGVLEVRPAKSKRFRSSRCEGATSVSARRIDSIRPGWVFCHSRSIAPICFRWRFSCEPQSVQGMMGNAFASA